MSIDRRVKIQLAHKYQKKHSLLIPAQAVRVGGRKVARDSRFK